MNSAYTAPLLEGFLLNAGLVISIGPQNTFILRQSLSRQYLHLMFALCVLLDALLMSLGTFGGGLLGRLGLFTEAITLVGIGFLLYYGLRSFRAAFQVRFSPAPTAPLSQHTLSRQTFILMLLAVTLLNPNTYLDIFVVIGGSASRYSHELRSVFTLGALAASVLWFASLSYGAALLAPLFKQRIAACFLELLSGSIMWFIAFRLWQHSF